MHSEYRHRGIHTAIAERQARRLRADHGGRPHRSLRGHDAAGLDGEHPPITRFVGAGTGAHVDHGSRLTQGVRDERGEAWVLSTKARVATTNAVVACAA